MCMWLVFSILASVVVIGTPPAQSSAQPVVRDDIVVFRDLAYRERASPHWKLDLAMKKAEGGKLRPGIVVIHGGGWIEGDKSSFSQRGGDVPGNILHFARLGFVAVTINYRLSSEAIFPAALDDCKIAVRWLRGHAKEYNLDKDRIARLGQLRRGPSCVAPGDAGQGRGCCGRWSVSRTVESSASGCQRQWAN